jgi:outer membrane biogenesis lipoprotein LolB
MNNRIKAFVLLSCALFLMACVGAPSEQTTGNTTQSEHGQRPNKKIKSVLRWRR